MKREKAEGEAGIYARESGDAKVGKASEELALEQLEFLRKSGRGALADGPGGVTLAHGNNAKNQ